MRACFLVAFTLAVTALTPLSVFAAGAVVGHQAAPTVVTGARIAVSVAPDRMTRWLEVTVGASGSGFVWLIPAAPGARVDLGSSAWLDALDGATTPTIVAPGTPSGCDAGVGVERVTGPSPAALISPAGSGVAVSSGTLAALVTAGGASLSSAEVASFDAVFAAGLDVVVLDYDTASSTATTQAVQIVESGHRSLDMPEAGGDAAYTGATVFVLAGSRAGVGQTSLTLDPAAIEWSAGGVSTYTGVVQSVLAASGGAAWVTNSAMPGRLLEPLLPAAALGGPTLPSVLDGYFAKVGAASDAGVDPGACEAGAATALAESGAVAELCPAGHLATVPGAGPCLVQADGGVSSSALVCAGATDAAFALAGLSAGSVWLTRATGALLPTTSIDVSLVATSGPPVAAILAASAYDYPCGAPSAGSSTSPGPTGQGAPGSSPAPAPTAPQSPQATADDAPSDAVDTAVDVASDVADSSSGGCDGSSSEPDGSSDGSGCDSSSGSSDDSGAGCDGGSDPDPSCVVHRGQRHPRGLGVRLLMVGMVVLAAARRSTRRSRVAV